MVYVHHVCYGFAYGRYNMQLVQISNNWVPITITLDDGADHAKQSIKIWGVF